MTYKPQAGAPSAPPLHATDDVLHTYIFRYRRQLAWPQLIMLIMGTFEGIPEINAYC